VTKLFVKLNLARALVVGITVVAALTVGGFFDGPH
jgi:hypothetical protein